MKVGIHPKYEHATITCACGNVIETRSTVKKHPGGNLLSLSTPSLPENRNSSTRAGRIERFNRKYGIKPSETK